MMDICPVCGEKSVTEDTENGRTVRVCTECGAMDDDMQELTSANQFEGTTVSDGKGYGPKGGKNWMKLGSSAADNNKTVGKKLITNIGHQLHVDEHIINEACHLFDRVYESELHNTVMDSKKAMCLACLYSSARMSHFPINIRDCCFYLNIKNSARRFGAALKSLKFKYDVHLPPLDSQDETTKVLSQTDLDKDVVRTANQIMLIMQRAMITSGRCCTSYAVPCAYIAFKASDIYKYGKLTYKAFCEMFKLQKSYKNSRSEIENALKAMAKELPWLKDSSVKIDRVEVYVKDIIKYQTSLFAQAVLTAVNEMEETDKDVTEVDEETILDSVNAFRKFPKRKRVPETLNENGEMKKQKSMQERKVARQNSGNSSDLDSFDLGSDDDTDQYILTPNEVKERLKINMQLGISVSNDHDDADIDNEKKNNVESLEKNVTDTEHVTNGERKKDKDNNPDIGDEKKNNVGSVKKKVKDTEHVTNGERKKDKDNNPDIGDEKKNNVESVKKKVKDKSDANDERKQDNNDNDENDEIDDDNDEDIDDEDDMEEGDGEFNHLLYRSTDDTNVDKVLEYSSDDDYYD